MYFNEYHQESEKKSAEGEKIFGNHIPEKTLVCRVYKELLRLKNNKATNLKMGKESKYIFLQRYANDQHVHKDTKPC